MSKANWVKFLPGRIVLTPGVFNAVGGLAGELEVQRCLQRHLLNDWGDLDEEDIKANDLSVQGDSRILSAYILKSGVKIWIITEGDRSATTVLLPEEY